MGVFVSAISNFYFFYMLVILTVFYVCVRLLLQFSLKEIKKSLCMILKIGGYAFVGVLLSACLFLPVVMLFLNDGRSEVIHQFSFLYDKSYYESFLGAFVSSNSLGSWTNMGFSSLVLFAIFLLFKERGKKEIKFVFVTLTVFLLLPIFGYVLNGFSYVSNRWDWGYSMAVAYIFVCMWDKMKSLQIKEGLYLFAGVVVYGSVCFLMDNSRTFNMMFSCLIAVLFLFAVLFLRQCVSGKDYQNLLNCILIITLFISIGGNAYFKYSVKAENYISEFVDLEKVNSDLQENQDVAIKKVMKEKHDSDFIRYSGKDLERNSTLISGLSNVYYYWSLMNKNIGEFFKELSILSGFASCDIQDLDSRTSLNALAAVKYYVVSAGDEKYVPFGYNLVGSYMVNRNEVKDIIHDISEELKIEELSKDIKNRIRNQYQKVYQVYENEYSLPLGYTYSDIISKTDFDKLSPLEKQEVMLQAVVLEEGNSQATEKFLFAEKEVPFHVACNSAGISQQGNSFIVTDPNASITLKMESLPESETYLEFSGLEYEGSSIEDLYGEDLSVDPLNLYTATDWEQLTRYNQRIKEKNKGYWIEPTRVNIAIQGLSEKGKVIDKNLIYKTDQSVIYAGQHDFLINLGYHEDFINQITIKFPNAGIYSFDSLEVKSLPMAGYAKKIGILKEDVLENVSIGTDTILGKISLDSPKVLCLSIPYEDGWKAYVDGKSAELYRANIMYLALQLDEGEHDIKLVYHTPGLSWGIMLSLFGIVGLITIAVWRRKKILAKNS